MVDGMVFPLICTELMYLIVFGNFCTVDVVYTWKYGGPHIITIICANEMKLCVYNAYVL